VLAAVRRLRETQVDDLDVLTPVPDEELLEAVAKRPSPVGFLTLAGGLFGMAFGFAGAALTHLQMGLITGGKPVVSVPPFIIVAFEMTVLSGALATLAGVVLLCRLPRLRLSIHYDPRASEDHYVLVVRASADRAEVAAGLLKAAGGEVRR
jgi:molybdopterin-containing oxidoreductase family membrane subunit